METGFVDINGVQLYFEKLGTGEPIVLIHGNTLDTRMWDDQFEHFAQQYQVIRYDLRGFGKSTPPPPEIYSQSDDIKTLLNHHGLNKAHILGLSLGGAVAIDFALTYPELTKSLIVVDGGLRGYQWEGFGPFYGQVLSAAKNEGLDAAKNHWMTAELFTPAKEKPDLAEKLKEFVRDYSGWHWFNNEEIVMLEPASIDQLEHLDIPTLVIVGEKDMPDFHKVADILHQKIPNAAKVVMPGVGHMTNMEDPENFNKIVLDFLKKQN